MRKMKNWLKILVIVPALFMLFSCNPLENDSKSDSVLLVLNILGTDIEDNEVNFLQSDVVTIDSQSGAAVVSDDTVSATLTAQTLDPEPILGTSYNNDIYVTRYVVSFSRTDGNNQEGVGVPYSFEGSLTARVAVDSQTDVAFILVRAVSKLEPPLINLREGRGEGVLKTTARIDFYGQDTLGNTVKATGYLSVYFANYVDKQASGGGGQ
jgi:hypothetical protein